MFVAIKKYTFNISSVKLGLLGLAEHESCASKQSDTTKFRSLSCQTLMRCGLGGRMRQSIADVNNICNSIRPKTGWEVGLDQHCARRLNDGTVDSFGNRVVLWSVRRRKRLL